MIFSDTILFDVLNVDIVSIINLEVHNTTFTNNSKLFNFKNCYNVEFQNLNFHDNKLDDTIGSVFKFTNM